jgi:ArsR family transcriptional regulator, lead/cadmium/zinc/bismuth-responsive transcriptional repressor
MTDASTRAAHENAEEVICGRGEDVELDRCEVVVVNPERVRAVRQRLMTTAQADEVSAIFKVLADPSRCRLVAAMIEAGELCVCDLAATVEMSESNASHHLRLLRSFGLVRAQRRGKMVYYSPDDAHIRMLLDTTREHVLHRADRHAGGRPER